MTEVLATRFTDSVGAALAKLPAASLLVRIYPVQSIEEPLKLGQEAVLVGRDAHCTLPLHDDSVSRRHALIEPHGDSHLISDLGSTNGTYVNEQQVQGAYLLQAGDRIRFGSQIFKYLSADKVEAQYHEVVFKLMTTDGLTSVQNKRSFLETLDRELHQSRRAGSPLCLALMDLDKFKSVNDTHGHLAGDAVLVEFARRVKSILRSGDLLARYGGEEFAMLMTRTTLADAVTVAERVRQITQSSPAVFEGHEISFTVSIGLSCTVDQPDWSADNLIAEADEQLYAAKNSGRNKVCHATGT